MLHEAFYIDNPFVIDRMAGFYNTARVTDEHLLGFLCKEKESIYDGIFDAVMAKDRLKEIYIIWEKSLKGR